MFINFRNQVQDQFKRLTTDPHVILISQSGKEEIFQSYLRSFPETEKQGFNCNSCNSFLRQFGSILIVNDKFEINTLWDFIPVGVDSYYAEVCKNLDQHVREIHSIEKSLPFYSEFDKLGVEKNNALKEGNVITWNHFHLRNLPFNKIKVDDIGTKTGGRATIQDVFERTLALFTTEALDTVLDLITSNSIYRGQDYLKTVEAFIRLKKDYDTLEESKRLWFTWFHAIKNIHSDAILGIKSSSIGGLIEDLSKGEDLTASVGKYEAKLAPANYKRPKALISPRMIEEAKKAVEELKIGSILHRRQAVETDLNINNILFKNVDAKLADNIFDQLKDNAVTSARAIGNSAVLITIKDLIEKEFPKSLALEMLFENRHAGNLVSIVTGDDSEQLFKWKNPFSWSYKNNLADSIAEKVKAAGGRLEGIMRGSLEWYNTDDLDLHIHYPEGGHIHWQQKQHPYMDAYLDVDMNVNGETITPVENIIFKNRSKLHSGTYLIVVNQFQQRNSTNIGFSMEIEIEGVVHYLSYNQLVQGQIKVATIDYKDGKFTFTPLIESKEVQKDLWGLKTNQFHKVTYVMNSPNYWDSEIGNKHYFFLIPGIKAEESVRPFFNEFLRPDLDAHRKVFETLGSSIKVEEKQNALGGLGFSQTMKNDFLMKIHYKDNTTRIFKVLINN